MAGPKHSELPAVVVPQHLWLRSARPVQGKVVQWALPGVLILAGLLASATTLRVSLVLAGFSVFLLLPGLVVNRLEQLGREVLAADHRRAEELLKTLPEHPLVRLFAPAGWRSLQLALLHLKLGDGHQAAQGFAETAQLCGQPEAVMLISAQAHAHVLAGERGKARELLHKLTQANLLGPRDQLDLGIVLLIESKKHKQALGYIEAARKTIGDHPRVVAAQALALQKIERIDEASVLLEQVQIATKDVVPDPVADDLIKRARKGLQDFLEAQLRRERRARSRRTTIVVSSEAAASEIVSGEISGSGEPTASETGLAEGRSEPAEPMKRFSHDEPKASPAQVPAASPRPVVPAVPEPDAPRRGLDIDLYSAPHTSAPALSELLKDRDNKDKSDEPKRSDSLMAALATAPTSVPAGSGTLPNLIPDIPPVHAPEVKADAKPPTVAASAADPKLPAADAWPLFDVTAPEKPASAEPAKSAAAGADAAKSTVVSPAPGAEAPSLSPPGVRPPTGGTSLFAPRQGLAPTPGAPAASDDAEKSGDADAPVTRRRQTLFGVLPSGEPGKPPGPNLPSLPTVAPPRTGLPTRATRLDLPAIGGAPVPNTPSPVFKAPPTPKPDDKKG